MDISKFLPKEVAAKYKFKSDIPGPVFTARDKNKQTVIEFDASTLTEAACEKLLEQKFPYIEKVGKADAKPAAADTK